jgi:general stress protein YciG
MSAHRAGKRFYLAARERLEKVGRKGGVDTRAA